MEIIIEYFWEIVVKKIGGRVKVMLVCGLCLYVKCYFEEFWCYIKEKGYEKEIKVLVVFLGKVVDDNYLDGVLELELIGYSEKELLGVFDKDEYCILIVVDKY